MSDHSIDFYRSCQALVECAESYEKVGMLSSAIEHVVSAIRMLEMYETAVASSGAIRLSRLFSRLQEKKAALEARLSAEVETL